MHLAVEVNTSFDPVAYFELPAQVLLESLQTLQELPASTHRRRPSVYTSIITINMYVTYLFRHVTRSME